VEVRTTRHERRIERWSGDCYAECVSDRCFLSSVVSLSDGTAIMSLNTRIDVDNPNFLSTGVDTVAIQVSHNSTQLNNTAVSSVKFDARTTNPLTFDTDFTPLGVDTFAGLFDELARTSGQLTLAYDFQLVTSENFRLRNIQVACTTVVQISVTDVPPTTQIMSTRCTHSEQTG
jgi:hypothetical protein